MKSSRLIVMLLIFGLVAVATDAQALACEVSCAKRMQHGSAPASPERHGMSLGHEHGMARHEGQASRPRTAAPHSQNHEAAATRHYAGGHLGSEMAKCVTVDRLSLASGVTPQSGQSSMALAHFGAGAIEMPLEHGGNLTSGSESPPARNGPLAFSSILRI